MISTLLLSWIGKLSKMMGFDSANRTVSYQVRAETSNTVRFPVTGSLYDYRPASKPIFKLPPSLITISAKYNGFSQDDWLRCCDGIGCHCTGRLHYRSQERPKNHTRYKSPPHMNNIHQPTNSVRSGLVPGRKENLPSHLPADRATHHFDQ